MEIPVVIKSAGIFLCVRVIDGVDYVICCAGRYNATLTLHKTILQSEGIEFLSAKDVYVEVWDGLATEIATVCDKTIAGLGKVVFRNYCVDCIYKGEFFLCACVNAEFGVGCVFALWHYQKMYWGAWV